MQPAEAPARRKCCLWSLLSGNEAMTWRQLLVRDHLEPQGRLGLFQACRGGRDLVLVEAETAYFMLTLAVDEDQPDMHTARAQVQAVKGALLTRGHLKTKLRLATRTTWLLSMAVGMLDGSTTSLGQLGLMLPYDQPLPPSILAGIAASCTNLQTLHIEAALDALPRPELFPSLDKLHVVSACPDSDEGKAQLQRIFSSIRPYIKQLTVLNLCQGLRIASTLPPFLFNPADSVGAHLSRFEAPMVLDDALLGLLLQCAPALQHLSVYCVQIVSDTHAAATATWQRLNVFRSLHLSSLARLPQAPGMELTMPTDVICDVSTPAAAVAVAAAVTRFKVLLQFHQLATLLIKGQGVQVEDQPTALSAGLSLLRAATKPNPQGIRMMYSWTMSAPLLLALHRGLPSWQVLNLGHPEWVPEPAAPYASLLRLLPSSFREVRIHIHGLTRAQIEHICLGAPVARPMSEAPFHIKLSGCEPGVVYGIQDKLQQQGVYSNVVVSRVV